MVEEYGVDLLQMMENAGRCLAVVVRDRFLGGRAAGAAVTVLAGPGGNGGGALVAARRLHGWGARVLVALSHPEERLRPATARQLAVLRKVGVSVASAGSWDGGATGEAAILVDGLIGYGLAGAPRGWTADLIREANDSGRPVVAVDVPSGVDATSGAVADPAVRAAATVTLALPKTGLLAPTARGHVGELYVADIGVPPSLYASPSLGLSVGPIFADGDILRLR